MFTINSGSKDITIYTGEGSTEVFDTKALNTRIQETVALMNSFNSFLESLFSARGYGMSFGGPGDPPDPFIDIELNIKFGLAFSDKLKIFGFGEQFQASAISFDYMTFKWNSYTNRIKYTPYRSASSSFSLGGFGIFGGVRQDWTKMQFIPYGQLGLLYFERGAPARFNIIDIGNMFGFGFDFKVTISPNKFLNSYIEYQSGWNDNVGWPMNPFMH